MFQIYTLLHRRPISFSDSSCVFFFFLKGTCTELALIWLLHCWSTSGSYSETPLTSCHHFKQGIFPYFILCFVSLMFKQWKSVTILDQGSEPPEELLGRVVPALSGSRSRPQFFFSWTGRVIRETTGSTFHSLGFKKRAAVFWCTTMVDVYCILWPWMCIDGGWGRGGRTVKTVCMSIVFCRASDGAGRYLYYVFYVRVKLNSWQRNIEALFKKNGTFIWIFLLLILTDVLLWVLC